MTRPKDFETREELLEQSDLHGVVPLKYIEEYLMSLASSEGVKYDATLADIIHNLHDDDLSRLVRTIEDTTIPNLVSLVDDPETDRERILTQVGIMRYAADNMADELEERRSSD